MNNDTYELTRLQNHKDLLLWACDCAYHVLAFYEEKHRKDLRPRKAIETGNEWLHGNVGVNEARIFAFASHAAARETNDQQAMNAAHSAGHAAATVHVKTHAVHAANYALKVFDYSDYEKTREGTWQHDRLLKIIKG